MPYTEEDDYIANLPELMRKRRLFDFNMPQPMAKMPEDLNPALSAYKGQIEKEPLREDYQPSKLRNILGTIASVGLMNPNAGEQVRYGGNDGYLSAKKNYDQKLQQKGHLAEVESNIRKSQLDQAKGSATIDELSARAEAERQRGINYANQAKEWRPTSEAEATRLEGVKHPVTPLKPVMPNVHFDAKSGKVVFANPESQVVSTQQFKDPDPTETPEEKQKKKIELLRMRYNMAGGNQQAGIRLRAELADEKQGETTEAETVLNQQRARRLAAEHLVAENPEYENFVDKDYKIVPPKRGLINSLFNDEVDYGKSENYNKFRAQHNELVRAITEKAKKKKKFDFVDDKTAPTKSKYQIQEVK